MRVHVSTVNGVEGLIDYSDFQNQVRHCATEQPTGDGGVRVTENVTILSFDWDSQLTIVLPDGNSYTLLTNNPPRKV